VLPVKLTASIKGLEIRAIPTSRSPVTI